MDLNELPILNPDVLKDNLDVVGKKLAPIMRKLAVDFVANNQADATVLGADTVTAILNAQIYEVMPIADLSANASAEEIAHREAECEARTNVFQLVAAAQLQDSERVARLTGNAKSLLGAALGVAAPLILKAVVTKMAG